MRYLLCALLAVALTAAEARPLVPEDVGAIREVSDPQFSPDGKWVAYTLQTTDLAKDNHTTHLWLAAWDGSENRQLTFNEKGESHPRWSPDSRSLAFLTSRDDANSCNQIWRLPLRGGEADRLTETPKGVEDFTWSPDSSRIALVLKELGARDAVVRLAKKENKTLPPIVIDRYYFKQDRDGYLTQNYSHLAVLEVATKKLSLLTSGAHDEILPSWSPDGATLAYSTKRGSDPDRAEKWEIYLVSPQAGAPEREFTHSDEANDSPDWKSPASWSPDSRSIAYVHGGPPKDIEYAVRTLATSSMEGGQTHIVTQALDRNIREPRWSPDGRSIYALVESDGTVALDRFSPDEGSGPETIVGGLQVVQSFTLGPQNEIAVLLSTPDRPFEIYAVEAGKLRALTHQNDAWLKTVPLAVTMRTQFKSKDGTEVHGFIARPRGVEGRMAALLRLHGGPQSQHDAAYSFDAQLFASNGYMDIMPNPRGSTGRGARYALGIYAAWGSVDVEDDLAAVDDAVAHGLADPKRLGVGGWSYGAMATNYLIASTTRFNAATSGAGTGNILAGFGTDEYVRDYIQELGAPWEHTDTWMRISYPFLHADRIKTPTLFMVGEGDFNVPALNSEQMYQALRQLEVPTQLIVYPGQSHALGKPSYVIDRYRRYLDWYAKWIPRSP